MAEVLKFEEMKQEPESRFMVAVYCAGCGTAELNRTVEMTGKEVADNWTKLMLSQPLATGKCPNGCRATFSDCNLNVDVRIERAADAPR